MGIKISYEDLEIVSPYEFQLETLKVIREAGEHSKIQFSGMIEENNSEEYILKQADNGSIILNVLTKDGKQAIFKGYITSVSIKAKNNVCYIYIEGKSTSFVIDINKIDRSFQNIKATYDTIFNEVLAPWKANYWIPSDIEKEKQEELILQYRETDWEFLKRIASQFGKKLVINDRLDKATIFLGAPDNGTKKIEELSHYTVYKDLENYLYNLENFQDETRESDYFTYEIGSTDLFFVGEKYEFLGKIYIVKKVVSQLKRYYLYQRVTLVKELKESPISNDKIQGVSLKGQILEVKGSLVKVHLKIDEEQKKEEAYFFSYSTPHSAGGNTGWYMMPKIGEDVEVHFPLSMESRAFARGTIRSNNNSLPSNSGTKELNVHGKSMILDGSAVSFNVKNDKEGKIHIRVTKDKGIEVISLKDIDISSGGDLNFDSKNISLKCGKEFFMFCKNSSFFINSDAYHFVGTQILQEGLIKAPIAPFPENAPEPPPPPPKPPIDNDTLLDGLQLGLSLLGFIPVFGAIADVANAGISAARGNWADAALNLVAAIPGIGDAAAIVKTGSSFAKMGKVAKAIVNSADIINTCTKVNKISKGIRVVTMVTGSIAVGVTAKDIAKKIANGEKLTSKDYVSIVFTILALHGMKKMMKGDPVDAITGDVYVETEDFFISGQIPISWKRYYRSGSEIIGQTGLGWQTPADARLELLDFGIAVFYDGTDVPKHFAELPNEGETVYELINGHKLTRYKDEYRLELKEGLTYVMPLHDDYDKIIYVTKILDNFGNFVEYTRINNIVKYIKENNGRRIRVDSLKGLIKAMYLINESDSYNREKLLVKYEYTDNMELKACYDAENLPYKYAYKNGVMIEHTNRKDFSFHYKYDNYSHKGKCIHTYGDDALLDYTFVYDEKGMKTEVIDSLGNKETIEYNEFRLATKVTDNMGGVTSYEYDDRCRTKKITNPDGKTTEYSFDKFGNTTEIIRPDGASIKTEFTENHKATSIIEPDGAIWNQVWDEKGLLTKSISPLGAEYTYEYDEKGQLIKAVNPLGYSTSFSYDKHGNLSIFIDEEGKKSKFAYDISGNLTEKIEEGNRTTKYIYDKKNRIKGAILPNKKEILCTYDPCDNLLSYRDEGRYFTTFEYDGNSNLIKKILPDGTQIEYEYDTEERLTSLTNQNDEIYELQRDGNGRIIKEVDYWGQERNYEYTPSGNLLKSTDPLGKIIEYSSDDLGRITLKKSEEDSETFAYDIKGNLVKAKNEATELLWEYDIEGKLLRELQGEDFVLENQYDILGQRTSRTTRLKGRRKTLEYEYSPSGMPKNISLNKKTLVDFNFDSQGRLKKETLGALKKQYLYDDDNRLESQSLLNETGELFKTEYSYDEKGNLRSRNDSINGKDEYYYDPIGRITRSLDPMKRNVSYTRDGAGNYLKTKVIQDENQWKRVGEYDNISYEYDKNGNLVKRDNLELKWDSNNRLTESLKDEKSTSYKYDPLGRRIGKISKEKETNFYWEGNTLISDTERYFYYYPNSFEPLAMEQQDELYYYHNDINGAPLRLTDQQGKVVWNVHYDVMGRIDIPRLKVNEVYNPIRMQGQYEDEETGLYYNRYRYFDPNICSYVSQDPIRLNAGTNLYSYGLNSFGWIDPLGLKCKTGEENPISKNMKKKIPNEEITAPEKRGNSPLSIKDNKPLEIHHNEQMKNGPFEEMHPSDHRYGDNYKKNHPNYKEKSKVDRTEFKKWKREYWEKEWDDGRW